MAGRGLDIKNDVIPLHYLLNWSPFGFKRKETVHPQEIVGIRQN